MILKKKHGMSVLTYITKKLTGEAVGGIAAWADITKSPNLSILLHKSIFSSIFHPIGKMAELV